MKKNILQICLITLIVLFLPMNSFGLVCHNDIIEAFSPTGSEDIDKNMINGATLFFKGNSYINMYYAEYEKASGKDIVFNYVAANEYLEKAIDLLNQSLTKYNEAYNLGVRVGYVKEKIDKLKNFKYDSISSEFRNQKAFSDAVDFFKDGDVLGIYKKNIEDLKEIIQLLKSFNDDTKKGVITKVDKVWDLLEINSESMCFGSYTTRIAKKIF